MCTYKIYICRYMSYIYIELYVYVYEICCMYLYMFQGYFFRNQVVPRWQLFDVKKTFPMWCAGLELLELSAVTGNHAKLYLALLIHSLTFGKWCHTIVFLILKFSKVEIFGNNLIAIFILLVHCSKL